MSKPRAGVVLADFRVLLRLRGCVHRRLPALVWQNTEPIHERGAQSTHRAIAESPPAESPDLMNAWNAVGFLAAGLVVTAFCMKDMLHLRIVAVASNVAFLAYGVAFGLMPVWLLHLVLLPVNLVRLWQVGNHIATEAIQDHGKARLVVRRARGRQRIRPQARRSTCEAARTR